MAEALINHLGEGKYLATKRYIGARLIPPKPKAQLKK